MEHGRPDHNLVTGSAPGSDPVVRCLQLHAGYRCRHSGACCTAGWAIPVEADRFETLRVHFGAQSGLFRTGGLLPEGSAAILGLTSNGACVFFDERGGRMCRVHRDLGPKRLPVACRQFPRVVLHDARGTSISLSHYCPTAASLLTATAQAEDHDPFAIVDAPASLAIDGEVEGLDAREALPPLLTPGLLMDAESYGAWERHAIATLASGAVPAAVALHAIAGASRRLQEWRPGRGRLRDAVDREFAVAPQAQDDEDLSADIIRVAIADASVPHELRRPPLDIDMGASWKQVAPWWPSVDRAVRAYLAARVFGNWIAYHGEGVDAIVEYLRVCLAVVKVEAVRHQARARATGSDSSPWQTVTEAIRSADLLLVHLSEPRDLARRLR